MEVTHRNRRPAKEPKTRHDLIVRSWRELGEPPIDAQLLKAIQNDLATRFGDDASATPASIARVLAGEGAELRHPEIIEYDAQWRDARLKGQADKLTEVEPLSSGRRLDLTRAEPLIGKLEVLRQEFISHNDDSGLSELKRVAVEARQIAQTMAKNGTLDEAVRAEQIEVAEWLKVWLQTPNLFHDWLELRRRSEEFRSRFPSRQLGTD